MLSKIINLIKLELLKRKWRKHNRNNNTFIRMAIDVHAVHVGNGTYGGIDAYSYEKEHEQLYIGHYCSIAERVSFHLGGEHQYDTLSTYPFDKKILGKCYHKSIDKMNIIIEDDVWIGYGATILSGVHIGQGAIIAAGAVINRDVPPYAIVGGIPGRVIKYRFPEEIILFLLTLDYGSLSTELVVEHAEQLCISLEDLDVSEIKRLYDWFPKKQDKTTNEF